MLNVRGVTDFIFLLFLSAALPGCGAEQKQQASLSEPAPGGRKNAAAVSPARTLSEGLEGQGTDTSITVASPARVPSEGPKSTAVKTAPAKVIRVVDGDTVYVQLGSNQEKVRFIGVDTPESTREVESYGKEAAAYTKKRLSGRTVYLEMDVDERDKYGRFLAYIWLSPQKDDSEAKVRAKMFNAELLLNGYAQVMTMPPNVKYADLFVKLQQEARKSGKGLWGAAAVPGGSSEANSKNKSRAVREV